MSELGESSAAPFAPIELVLEPSEAGKRLDLVLSARALGFSRSALQRWMEDGRVLMDGVPGRARDKARAGARVCITPAPPPPSDAIPQDIPLDVEFEDASLLVLHKPSGLVVHPAAGHPDGTLVNAVRFHTEVQSGGDPRRPGIVHRLDRDTSGLMVVAKTDQAREGLTEQFKAHSIDREYLAIVLGRVGEPLHFDTLHGRHPTDRKRFSGRVQRGKRAVTHVWPVGDNGEATLVRCRLETGRTHQIRVHLSEAGHPLLADPIYGRKARGALLPAAEKAIGRLALHARLLGFVHPVSGERLVFERPPPQDFAAALARLELD